MKKIISLNLKEPEASLASEFTTLNWTNFQDYLHVIYHKTNDLNLVLDLLWQQQLEAGFISKGVLQHVTNLTEVTDPISKLKFVIEYNPARLNRGTAAKLNPNPVNILPGKNIPCFCCHENIKSGWPNERGFEITINKEQYIFLPNPAPLFKKHFTLVSKDHRPMTMDIGLVLEASKRIKGLWIAQNGANAGASNPWHFHLQVADVDFPITEISAQKSLKKKMGNSFIIVEKLDYPFSVYRFRFNKLNKEIVSYLTELQNYYLALDPNNRLTYAVKNIGDQFEAYFTLRSALKERVASYSENVGYPEPLGFLATPFEKEKSEWVKNGVPRYQKVLKELNIDSNYVKKFEGKLFT